MALAARAVAGPAVRQGLGDTLQHGLQVFATAGAVVRQLLRPGIELARRDVVPWHAFPAAKVQLAQAGVRGLKHQIGP